MLLVKVQRSTLLLLFLRLLAGLILVPVLLVGWWYARGTDRIGTPFDNRAFNAVTWRAMKDSAHREGRAEMAHDLMRHHLRAGMPESKILPLLGPQDKTWPKGEYTPSLPHDVYEYDMGPAPMDIAGQHYVFRLYFDRQGRYQSSEITRD